MRFTGNLGTGVTNMATTFFRPMSNASGLVEMVVVDYDSVDFENIFDALLEA